MKYRAITANCGNDVIGKKASEAIAAHLHEDEEADFYIINCQETSIDATREQLQKAVGNGYKVDCLAQMATHTKLSTQFHSHTGLGTFIIYKKDLSINLQSIQLARRSHNRLSGSGYNKGGLVTDFTVTKNKGSAEEEQVHVQAVSGHLDSNHTQKRTKDWHCINRALSKEVKSWNELVSACPNLRISGYDANTRNRFTKKGESVNLWQYTGGTMAPEMQALYQAAIAGQHFSSASTYKTHKDDVTTIPDKKRPGYAFGGMLDFVGISDGRVSSKNVMSDGIVPIAVDPEDSGRDHDILMSPLQDYTKPVSDFENVRGQIAQRLERSAPHLAQEIRALEQNNEENRNKLLSVYRLFLSPKGLLNQAIALHIEKLDFIQGLTDPVLEQNKHLKKSISEILFPITSTWFAEARLASVEQFEKQYQQQVELTKMLMGSLEPYPGAAETTQRLQVFTEQLQSIKRQEFNLDQAQQAFKAMQIKEYDSFLSGFSKALETYEADTEAKKNLVQKGQGILGQINSIVPNKDQLNKLSSHELTQINSILKYSTDSLEGLNKGADITPMVSQLAFVAQNVSGKSSKWGNLAASLLAFAGIALVVAGVLAAIPTGGASLLFAAIGAAVVGAAAGVAGVKVLEHNPEKPLAKSVEEYKSALQTLSQEESLDQDNSLTNSSK